ncbi:hypothetical protein AAVH_10426 [Aphelenchoides avenae]|nr:hypothetical protein AAVH_10426 [Aphelenchus avenae]
MPELLIGQDLAHLFDRSRKPTLLNGYYIVTTCIEPTIAGALRSVTSSTEGVHKFQSPCRITCSWTPPS